MAIREIVRWKFSPKLARAFTAKNFPNSGKLQAQMIPNIKRGLLRYTKKTVTRAFNDKHVKSRTGKLKKSMRKRTKVFGTTRVSRVFASIKGEIYGRLREFGGIVKPKNGPKMLTIPLRPALKPNGSLKRKKALSWKATHNTFIFPPRNKRKAGSKLFIAFKLRNKLVFLYRLVKSTKHPNEASGKNLGLRRNFKKHKKELGTILGTCMFQTYRQFDLMKEVSGKSTGK